MQWKQSIFSIKTGSFWPTEFHFTPWTQLASQMELAKLHAHAWFACVCLWQCVWVRERGGAPGLDNDDSSIHPPTPHVHTHTHTHVNSDMHSLPSSLKTLLAALTDANCSQSAHQGSCQCTVKPDHANDCLLILLQADVILSSKSLCVRKQMFDGLNMEHNSECVKKEIKMIKRNLSKRFNKFEKATLRVETSLV